MHYIVEDYATVTLAPPSFVTVPVQSRNLPIGGKLTMGESSVATAGATSCGSTSDTQPYLPCVEKDRGELYASCNEVVIHEPQARA